VGEPTEQGAARGTVAPQLLLDQFLPQYDLAIAHAQVFRVPGASRATFRLKDMVGLGWTLLGETPGSEMVLGQVSRPWKAVAAPAGSPLTPERFVSFDGPGFAKIATSLRVDPYGNRSSILTMETRVAVTDDASRRRFRSYWLLVGPFSDLIRRTTLRRLAVDLRRPVHGEPREGAGAA